MGNLVIKTNYQFREIEYQELDGNDDLMPCFTYKGDVYPLSDFPRTNGICGHKDFADMGYHAYMILSAFNGLLIKLNDSCDMVQVSRYYARG